MDTFESLITADLARAGRALCIPSADMRALYVATRLLPYPLALAVERALMR